MVVRECFYGVVREWSLGNGRYGVVVREWPL